MAAPTSRRSCFQCADSSSDSFMNGWKLRSGGFAQLCRSCVSLYEEGKFCEAFHSGDDGWRDCEKCGKLVHCGCVASFNTYFLLDYGGVSCMECSKKILKLARSRRYALELQTGPTNGPDLAMLTPTEPPHCTPSEAQCVPPPPKSVLKLLFEKPLSSSDADFKLGRIVIPKKYAESFFPEISDPQGVKLSVLDTEGEDWDFYFRFWPNCGGRMYVIEGLHDFIVSKKLQVGDTVVFYRIEPGGKMVLGFKKTSAVEPTHQASN